MRTGYQLAQCLKNITTEGNERTARSLFVAQAIAYGIPIDLSKTCEDCCADADAKVRGLIGEVNEFTPIDTRLTYAMFKKLMDARYEVVMGPESTALIEAILSSPDQEDQLVKEQTTVLRAMVQNGDFRRQQSTVKNAMLTHFDVASGEE